MKDHLQEHYHQYTEQLRIQTISIAKQAAIVVPNIFSKDETLISEDKPEYQATTMEKIEDPHKVLSKYCSTINCLIKPL